MLEYIWANKEWIFSGAGVLAASFLGKMLLPYIFKVVRGEERAQAGKLDSPQPSMEKPIDKEPKAEAKPYIVEYVVNPIVPSLTVEEVAFLRRFIHFPRSPGTQGYRLDWIYNELLADMPNGVVHLIMESLLAKGFLERWTTRRGNKYYKLAEDAIPFMVNNGFLQTPKHEQQQ